MKLAKHLLLIDGILAVLYLSFNLFIAFKTPYCGLFIRDRFCGVPGAFMELIKFEGFLYPTLVFTASADILYSIIYFAIKFKNSTLKK